MNTEEEIFYEEIKNIVEKYCGKFSADNLDDLNPKNSELCHIELDQLLTKTLSALGFSKGIELYEAVPKYYI